MANFTPWKKYMLLLVDEMIAEHNLTGPFLDVGCGNGDVALYFAQKGWHGMAIDPSSTAIQQAHLTLAQYTNLVTVGQQNLSTINQTFNTIFAFDVIEHIDNDREFIRAIRGKIDHKGALIISVPIKPKEWRWDDNFYGHVRRYELNELFKILREAQLEVVESWDCTFPFFWLMRRVYTKLFPKKYLAHEDKTNLTMQSASQSAWDQSLVINYIVEHVIWWRPLFFIQHLFRKSTYGCERLLLIKLSTRASSEVAS